MIHKGDIFDSKNHGKVVVVKYNGCNNITIRFLKCGTEKIVASGNLRKGEVSPLKSLKIKKNVYDYIKKNPTYKNYEILEEDYYHIKFRCYKCDEDCIGKVLGSKTFETRLATFKEGKVCCRCSKYYSNDELEDKVFISDILNNKGTYVGRYLDKHKNKHIIKWVCNKGHEVETNRSDLVSKRTGCPKCSRNRLQNHLYVTKLTKGDDKVYTKLGVTSNPKSRILMYEKEGLVVSDFIHIDVNSIYCKDAKYFERRLLKASKIFNVRDYSSLKGYTGYTEIFKEQAYDDLKNILLEIKATGDFSEYSLKDIW